MKFKDLKAGDYFFVEEEGLSAKEIVKVYKFITDPQNPGVLKVGHFEINTNVFTPYNRHEAVKTLYENSFVHLLEFQVRIKT